MQERLKYRSPTEKPPVAILQLGVNLKLGQLHGKSVYFSRVQTQYLLRTLALHAYPQKMVVATDHHDHCASWADPDFCANFTTGTVYLYGILKVES
jgi:hypothetical protein